MRSPITIPTEREGVVLRELVTDADDLAYFDAYNASREEIIHFDPDAATRYLTVEKVRESRTEAEMRNKLRFGIWHKDAFVGSINLTPFEDIAEIGYWRDSRHKGGGYTTFATRALASYASERYRRVFANVREGNKASASVLERSGFWNAGLIGEHLLFIYPGNK